MYSRKPASNRGMETFKKHMIGQRRQPTATTVLPVGGRGRLKKSQQSPMGKFKETESRLKVVGAAVGEGAQE